MASKEQRKLMQDFYDHSGFEFMEKDAVRADDPTGFLELWNRNIRWLMDMATECNGLITKYRNKHGE